MSSIALERNEVIIGVDTHKDEHIGVALDGLEGRIGELTIPATGAGYARLLARARDLGRVHARGVEGTGSYGAGLARFLRRQGELVVEVGRRAPAAEGRAAGPGRLRTPRRCHATKAVSPGRCLLDEVDDVAATLAAADGKRFHRSSSRRTPSSTRTTRDSPSTSVRAPGSTNA